jgi:hypothetical protein
MKKKPYTYETSKRNLLNCGQSYFVLSKSSKPDSNRRRANISLISIIIAKIADLSMLGSATI